MELLIQILFYLTLLIGVLALLLVSILYFNGLLRNEVKKGNKDQQEIKTRLTWLRKNLEVVKKQNRKRGGK